MTRLPLLLLGCLALLGPASALADEIFTITADSTLDGNAGVLMTIQDPPGTTTGTWFLLPQANSIRVYATRDAASAAWDVPAVPIFLVPKNHLTAGDSWRYLDDEDGGETIATAIAEESVDTPAGTFLAWRVDVALASSPAKLVRSLWFADDVGLVREVEYFDQWIAWEGLLDSYTAGGNGNFPLNVGNSWWLTTGAVPTTSSSLSSIKGHYLDQ